MQLLALFSINVFGKLFGGACNTRQERYVLASRWEGRKWFLRAMQHPCVPALCPYRREGFVAARGGGNAKIRGFEPFGRPWGSFVRLKCSRLLYAAWFSAEHTGA